MAWNSHCSKLINWSQKYLSNQKAGARNISQEWDHAIHNCKHVWETQNQGFLVEMEYEDKEEYEEEEILEQELLDLGENEENTANVLN
jgi:hypothetical protein